MKAHKGVQIRRYSFLTSPLAVNGQFRAPGRLSPGGMTPMCPLNSRLGDSLGKSGISGKEKKILTLSRIKPRFLSFPSPSNL